MISSGASESLRRGKRTSKACESCRRLKEKCDGQDPCARCIRTKRRCKFSSSPQILRSSRRTAREPIDRDRSGLSDPPWNQNSDFLDADRIKALETLVQHFTGSETFDLHRLRQLISSLSQQSSRRLQNPQDSFAQISEGSDDHEFVTDAVSPAHAVYLGEFSDSNFSSRVQQKVQSQLRDTQIEAQAAEEAAATRSPTAIQLQSKAQVIVDVATIFPPREIAFFLLHIFFEYAQTNYFYVDERFLRLRLREFYSSPLRLDSSHAPWVCTLLMMFAIGTQFAHLESHTDSSNDSGEASDQQHNSTGKNDHEVGLSFYHAACRLIPDVIADASIESVQAFLLLGVYALPVDAAGLSCTYFGIAIKIATQNGMHRNFTKSLDERQVELRRRIFWTAVTLERRICIFHGRPISLARSDIDVQLPVTFSDLKQQNRVDTFPNVLAMIQLTDLLESARTSVTALKRSRLEHQSSKLQSIVELKQRLQRYWKSTSENIFCRDLDPSKPLFRFNIHLALTYHLIYIFIGRSFIFTGGSHSMEAGPVDSTESSWNRAVEELVKECIQSAREVIDLCQLLRDQIGLAKSSYTEFTSCCTALLALLAYRISSRATGLQGPCSQGLHLLKAMSAGIFSNKAERLALESLEAAIQKLDRKSNPISTPDSTRSAYQQFRDWALGRGEMPGDAGRMLLSNPSATVPDVDLQNRGRQSAQQIPLSLQEQERPQVQMLPSDDVMLQNFELEEFGFVPGLDQWFQYGLH